MKIHLIVEIDVTDNTTVAQLVDLRNLVAEALDEIDTGNEDHNLPDYVDITLLDFAMNIDVD